MSYSRRELYALGEPIGDSATYRKADGGLVLGDGGGGGSAPAPADTTQVQTQELPEWAKGYAKDVLAKGEALTDLNQNPYQEYGGQRTAEFSNLQKQAFAGAGPQGYEASVGQYMSPYIQNVLNTQMDAANRQYDITGMQQRAAATQQGAFGGGREAIMRMENERARNSALQGIQAKGMQDAFTGATQQYNTGLGQMQTLGNQQQAQEQKGLDLEYQEFINRQNQPYKQLSYMSDLIRGQPLGMQATNQVYQAPPSTIQNITGLGLGAAGIASLMKADGGVIRGYADGGSVNTYAGDKGSVTSSDNVKKIVHEVDSDQELQTALKAAAARRDIETVQAIQQEMAFRASMRNGLAGTITPEMAQRMAGGGGVLAFAGDEDENDPMYGQMVSSPGDPRAFSGFNQEILRSMKAIREQQPSTMTAQDYNKAIANRYAMLGSLSGPDPYADSLSELGEQEKGISGMGNIARAAALFEGANAAVQGGNAMRGITGAGAKVGQGFAQAARAEALEKRALNSAKFNIKDAQRKERQGMTKDAISAADDARRSMSEANKFALEKEKALGNLAAQGARATKPTGGAGSKTPKIAEQNYVNILANLRATSKPNEGESPKAFEARLAREASKVAVAEAKTSESGPGKLGVSSEANEIKRIKMYEEALGDLRVNKEYVRATPERQRAMEAEVRTRVMSQPLPQDDGVVKLARGGNIGPIKLD